MADMNAGILDLRVPGANRGGIDNLLRSDPMFVPGSAGARVAEDMGLGSPPPAAPEAEPTPPERRRGGGASERGVPLTEWVPQGVRDYFNPQEPTGRNRPAPEPRTPAPQEPGMTTGAGLTSGEDLLPPSAGLTESEETPQPPERVAAAGNSPVAQAASRGLVDPTGEEAYGEGGTRDDETRRVSLIDRIFGEDGTPERRQAGIALMRAGAAMMTTDGNLGDAIGNAINAGLASYDEGMSALREEERIARQMGMEEEAHQMRMALDRLRMRRLEAGPVQVPVPTAEERMLAAAEVLESASHFVTGMDPAIVEMYGGPTQAARALASNSGGMRFPANAPREDTSPFAGLLD